MPPKPQPRRKTITRYVDQHGCQVPKGTPGARKVRSLSDTYYFRGETLKTTDLAQAWVEVRKIMRRAADEAAGIRDQTTDHAARPLTEHLEDWHKALCDSGVSEKEAGECKSHVTWLAGQARWQRLGDVSARTCIAALAHLRNVLLRSPQTSNHYLRHAKQFLYWCLADRRVRENVLVGIKPANVETDRRHDRRAPTDDEIAALMKAIDHDGGPVRKGMTGPQRALGYRVAMAAGLRAGELRTLTRESFDLSAGEVTVRAAYDKRRRKVSLPLPGWLVAELRTWFASAGGTWQGFPAVWPGRLLRADLEAAGVPYSIQGPDGPLFFDFHSLRHWYCTWAVHQPGISPRTLMELCRHSTPTLTMKVYAKAKRAELHRTVADMERPGTRKGRKKKASG